MEEKFCGVWGHLREEYLKANKPELYELMVAKNELEDYLTGYQTAYSSRAEKMAEKLAAERGVDDNSRGSTIDIAKRNSTINFFLVS